jgi:type I restriction enzyme S subunit
MPPKEEIKAIAHILGTLDDKIELNQQMNRTLEGIARTLFKSWFIDFDPVRAKLDGRHPDRMDAETAALFPDAFEDGGAIGPIPKDWQVKSAGEICQLKYGKIIPKK